MMGKTFLIFFIKLSGCHICIGENVSHSNITSGNGAPVLCDAQGNFYTQRRDGNGDSFHSICNNSTHLFIDLNGYIPKCIYLSCQISNRMKYLVNGILPSLIMLHKTVKKVESNTMGLLPNPVMIHNQVESVKKFVHKSEKAIIKHITTNHRWINILNSKIRYVCDISIKIYVLHVKYITFF